MRQRVVGMQEYTSRLPDNLYWSVFRIRRGTFVPIAGRHTNVVWRHLHEAWRESGLAPGGGREIQAIVDADFILRIPAEHIAAGGEFAILPVSSPMPF